MDDIFEVPDMDADSGTVDSTPIAAPAGAAAASDETIEPEHDPVAAYGRYRAAFNTYFRTPKSEHRDGQWEEVQALRDDYRSARARAARA